MASQDHISSSITLSDGPAAPSAHTGPTKRIRQRPHLIAGPRDPQWYKDAIIYEVHVRAFKDSDADGIGDFRGLTEKLDYLHDLGITTVWLLPFYPSPLRDDGYDIADYYSINPIYGTLRDFKRFLAEAHRRNLRVVTELVVNHTSDQHPWFQRSRRAAPGSAWRDFYVWSEHPDKYREARIIFRDFEPSNWSWDPLAKAYFWHRFYAHQPDLNFDNPLVHKEITRVLDFWLDMGVDGLRLDAVPYLYEREGTSCENLVETHGFLKELRRHVDAKYGDRMLLAEANQWPEDAVTYFGGGTGDECHMVFHFPLMPRLFMAVRMEDRVPILDILEQTPLHPETSQWAVFLRNHDELTLEMVTDEERDYMYRVYADDIKARINMGIRRRLSPLLGSDRKRIELLHLLLFSLSGTPVLYYGDEIGMGDNIFLGDRNGVRTPMQWSSDKNAGFSRASPQALYLPIILDPEFHYEAVNVEAQERNPHSLLWWMRRVLILRKRHKAFGRGSLRFLEPENRRVLVFVRQHEGETILVIANLSRFPQPVQIDLSEFQNQVPIELFGRTRFPIITARPYFLTLSPHAALWFALEPPAARDQSLVTPGPAQKLLAVNSWEEIFLEKSRSVLETRLMAYFKRGWVSLGVNRECKSVQVRDLVRMPAGEQHFMVLYLGLEPVEGDLQEYILVTGFATGVRQARIEQRTPGIIICELRVESLQLDGLLYEAGCDPAFNRVLFEAFLRRRSFDGMQGELKFAPAGWFRAETAGESGGSELTGCHIEPQTISSIFRDKYLFKWFRLVQPGINPDLEVASFLEQRHFPHTPAIAGTLEYRRPGKAPMTLGILRQYVAHARVGYHYTLDMLGRYFERVRSAPSEGRPQQSALEPLLVLAERQPSEEVVKLIGTYFELARLLGHNTADLHMALASDGELRDFAPEPLTPFYQRALFQSMRNQAVRTLQTLQSALPTLPAALGPEAEKVIALAPQILASLRTVYQTPLSGRRIRCHGNLHLGQVLFTGKSFIFINFEGDFSRSSGEQRLKRSPLRDVAGMIRSFDYASRMAAWKQVELGVVQEEQMPQFEPWSVFWQRWVSATFLRAYLERARAANLLPDNRDHLAILFGAHLLTKTLHDLAAELYHGGRRADIHLKAILALMESSKAL